MLKVFIVALALLLPFSADAFAKSKGGQMQTREPEKTAPKPQQLKYEAVSFKTRDGYELKGDWFPAVGKGAPVALLLHQLGTNRSEMLGLAKVLQQKGISALAYDARGHGESTAKDGKKVTYESFQKQDFEDMTLDIDAALAFLRQQKKTGKVPAAIVGASIQSSTGLIYASKHPDIKALVMLSPGLDYHGIDTAGPMQAYGKRPVFIASSIEDAASYKASKDLEKIAEGPKKRVTISDGGHGAAMFRKDPRLMEEVAGWLKGELE